MDFKHISYERVENIALITLNRPEKLNAFTLRMMHELCSAFDQVDTDDQVKAALITGAGRAFCAGADLSSGEDTFVDKFDTHEYQIYLQKYLRHLINLHLHKRLCQLLLLVLPLLDHQYQPDRTHCKAHASFLK